MSMGFNITTNNADTAAFLNWMNAAWYDPTYRGNVLLDYVNIPVTMDLIQPTGGERRAPLNGYDMNNAVSFLPGEFGLAMHAALTDPTIWSDGTLSNFDIGLSSYLNASYANGFFDLNPFAVGLNNNVNWNFNLNWSAFDNLIPTNVTYNLDKKDNNDKTVFEKKVKLLAECGDFDDEIEEIRKKIGSDYKKGIKEIDKLFEKVDATTLHEKANELYKEDFETVQENAANIANQWASKIANVQPTNNANFKVSMSGVNKNNILDVLGNFITNEDYVTKGSAEWKTLIENNFKEISKILIDKAKEMKKEAKDDSTKQAIEALINNVKKANSNEQKVDNTYELFKKLREIQAQNRDKDAYNRYGIPADKVDNNRVSNVATATYNKEVAEYKKQKAKLDKAA